MSYQVLARKWRPRIFAEMAGQQHVLQALINALDHDRLHHAYLFTGTRGVGKTTIARILSKCLNCEAGVSSVPCGECASCTEISEGRFIDLIEVDAASRTGVDDMRELLDNVQYAPSRGRYKIYLIDEVHMLSKSSFAALLKTLEEPPPHVKFLFATTDPQKLPITVLSRCLQFNLKNLSAERITEHLQFVLGEEQVPFEDAALWSLARAADGSMRDALSLTDQAIGHGGGQVNEGEVSAMLGTIERSFVVDICQALISGSGAELLAAIGRMAEQAPDYDAALTDILSVWHQVAIVQTVPEALDKGVSNYSELLALAAAVSREDTQLFYQICLLGRKDLQLSPDAKSGFEMVMLRALAFRPQSSARVGPVPSTTAATVSSSSSDSTGSSSALTPPPEVEPSAKKSEAVVSAVVDDRPPWEPQIQPVEQVVVSEQAAVIQATAAPITESVVEQVAEPATEFMTQPSAQSAVAEPLEQYREAASQQAQNSVEPAAPAPIPLADFAPENWIQLRRQLSIGASLGEIASHCLYLGRNGQQLNFLIDSDHNSLYDDPHQQQFSEALSAYFQQPVTVEITLGVAEKETPRAATTREKAERLVEAVESLNQDPAVVKFKQLFDGALDEGSVRPID
ncbi:DNA polymerase III subunit gamma/tau [SAR92 clade bacterium H455]|uniref:DNA polymerase III subunit gamma/tau n=1 Tax=SAR92 clade bacterium H455 TaxID=2974818 RepID=A0ABY5TJ68_9GAMM|nr:DNA polymerase III subunit gamma/tau [SAR92 clade bacterium H455]